MTTGITIGRLSHDGALIKNVTMSGGPTYTLTVLLGANPDEDPATTRLLQSWAELPDNLDEAVVPCTFAAHPDLDGYFEVTAASVIELDIDNEGNFTGHAAVTVTLRRVSARPLVEDILNGDVLSNDHSIDWEVTNGARAWYAFPTDADAPAPDSGTDRTTATGDVHLMAAENTDGETMASSRPAYKIAPGDHYDGAVTIEVDVTEDDAGWETLLGRTWPLDSALRFEMPADYYGTWRLGNGLVRVSGYNASPTTAPHLLRVEHYDDGAGEWQVTNTVKVNANDFTFPSTNLAAPSTPPDILRNAPEGCTIAFHVGGDAYRLILSLRRGSRSVFGFLEVTAGTNADWAILGETTSVTATTDAAGMRRTSDDSNGHRWIIWCPDSHTLSSGELQVDTADEVFRFGLGLEYDGSSATGEDTAQSEQNKFYAAIAERQVVAP